MSLESADPHDSGVLREKNRTLGKFVKNALFIVYDVTTFIERFHVAKQIYFPKQLLFMVNDDLS